MMGCIITHKLYFSKQNLLRRTQIIEIIGIEKTRKSYTKNDLTDPYQNATKNIGS